VNFFPAKSESAAPAKEVCGRCLVREECLDFALCHDINDGVWGGVSGRGFAELRRLTPRERDAINAERKRHALELLDRARSEGRSVRSVAEQVGVTTTTLYTWRSERDCGARRAASWATIAAESTSRARSERTLVS
jgi:transposase-like protein